MVETDPQALIFWEKPGCAGNNKQKLLLRKQGINLQVRNLLTTVWTAESLRPFFTGKPVSEWFNLSAPAVKSGRLDLQSLSESEALNLMVSEPLLICRPLLKYHGFVQSGFVKGPVLEAVNFKLQEGEDLQSCLKEKNKLDTTCGVSA
jgi:nitrogenase-associated protein